MKGKKIVRRGGKKGEEGQERNHAKARRGAGQGRAGQDQGRSAGRVPGERGRGRWIEAGVTV